MRNINLIETIKENCKEWERLNNDGKMIEEYLCLNKCSFLTEWNYGMER